jgi:hypothetical protein
MWIKDEQCKGVIEQAWNERALVGSPMFQVVEKLKSCRASLIGWSSGRFGSLVATIKDKRVHLQNLMHMSPLNDSHEKVEVQNELNELLENE